MRNHDMFINFNLNSFTHQLFYIVVHMEVHVHVEPKDPLDHAFLMTKFTHTTHAHTQFSDNICILILK